MAIQATFHANLTKPYRHNVNRTIYTMHQITTNYAPLPQAGGHVHIDRMTFSGPLDHKPLGDLIFKDIPGLGLQPVGAAAYTPKRRRNALPDELFIKSYEVQRDERAYRIRFDCCPPQMLQGHNFFGHADALDYANALFEQQTAKHHLGFTSEEREMWRTGRLVTLSEIHLCGNFWFPPDLKALFINAIDEANRSGKQRAIESCITLGLGESRRSTHHGVCIYDKHRLLLKQWSVPGKYQAQVLEMADGSIRIEVRLFEAGLAYRNLKFITRWNEINVDALFFELLAGYNVGNAIQPLLTADEKRSLRKTELVTYTLWLLKQDLRQFLSSSTISRHARAIEEATGGMNILSHRRPERLPALDLSEQLTAANLVPLPVWALESGRYWAPGQRAQTN